MSDYLEFDPSVIDKREVYRLLTGAVVPRPIGWASTVNGNGVTNLAPFSFFTVVCVVPPMISLTIARNPDGSEKHTLKNVRETGEFCFNVVTQPATALESRPPDSAQPTGTSLRMCNRTESRSVARNAPAASSRRRMLCWTRSGNQ